MPTRRTFLKLGALGGLLPGRAVRAWADPAAGGSAGRPVVVSTWSHGLEANETAWEILAGGGRALDAVEVGVKVVEADPSVHTVGIGGLPDRSGRVTLDASIMDERGNCGSVACIEHIKHPIAVARRVMEKTPHVMLVGSGALQFALAEGFPRENLLTPESEAIWRKWQAEHPDQARVPIDEHNHDTIGMLALDRSGNLTGACTTSGAAWKLPGRVGDSPIIGAGLYVDNEVGGACSTGWGEAVIRIVGCHLVVELMRAGLGPEEACREAVNRVIGKSPDDPDIQVGFLALDRAGRYGAYAIHPGFNFAVRDAAGEGRLIDAASRG